MPKRSRKRRLTRAEQSENQSANGRAIHRGRALQIVCYFKYTPEGAKRMSGAPVELDKKLGGVIAALRTRSEFVGDELETILITPPKNSIKAKSLLLVGLGPEESLSLTVLERFGRV